MCVFELLYQLPFVFVDAAGNGDQEAVKHGAGLCCTNLFAVIKSLRRGLLRFTLRLRERVNMVHGRHVLVLMGDLLVADAAATRLLAVALQKFGWGSPVATGLRKTRVR